MSFLFKFKLNLPIKTKIMKVIISFIQNQVLLLVKSFKMTKIDCRVILPSCILVYFVFYRVLDRQKEE